LVVAILLGTTDAGWQSITWVELTLYPAVVSALFVLSIKWFHQITMGLLKALGISIG
jgi:hypothetical protein